MKKNTRRSNLTSARLMTVCLGHLLESVSPNMVSQIWSLLASCTISHSSHTGWWSIDNTLKSSNHHGGCVKVTHHCPIFIFSALACTLFHLSTRKPAYFHVIVPRGDRIPLLQYVDGTLIFFRAKTATTRVVQSILQLYGQEAGLLPNLGKLSIIFNSGTDRQTFRAVR